jgi:hypothetical protein
LTHKTNPKALYRNLRKQFEGIDQDNVDN